MKKAPGRVLISRTQIHFLPRRELYLQEADTVAVVELAAVGVVQLQHIRDADGYDGLVGTNDPEEIYTLFRDPVPGYDGRPIGISDVLELYDADGSEFYYCDRVGFRQIEFAPRQEMDLCP
jgi:hypothetical protein